MATVEFRRLKEVAKEDLLELMNKSQVIQHMPLAKKTFDESDLQKFVAAKEGHWEEHGFGPWAFYVDGVFAGWGGLQMEGGDVEIAIVLHPKFWGYGKEIYKRIIKEAFEERGFKSIILLFPPSRSRVKGLERLGFKRDGELLIEGHKFLRYRLNA